MRRFARCFRSEDVSQEDLDRGIRARDEVGLVDGRREVGGRRRERSEPGDLQLDQATRELHDDGAVRGPARIDERDAGAERRGGRCRGQKGEREPKFRHQTAPLRGIPGRVPCGVKQGTPP
jgi:hypothetical protein